MVNRKNQQGFSLLEMVVSVAVMMMAMSGLASLLIQNARVNKAQRMQAEVQGNARNTLSMVVQKMRSAGWDPAEGGLAVVTTDTNLGDTISEIEVFADLSDPPDGDADDDFEQILIRHLPGQNTVVWRKNNNVATAFDIVSNNISNDANGDGTPEPMFTPDATPNPTRVTVTVTAQSPVPDPTSGQFLRYTVSSEVVLRKNL